MGETEIVLVKIRGISLKFLVFVVALVSAAALAQARTDVLFITIDDMNTWNSLYNESAPIRLPNITRLAKRGTLFTRAYCSSAACNPSRASVITGLRPSTTGVYGNKSDWRGATPKRRTIMQQFMRNGYRVEGAGKIFHHHLNGAFHDKASFHDFLMMAPQNMPKEKLNKSPQYGSRNTDWGAWPESEHDTIDYKSTEYCIEALTRKRADNAPLFLAFGVFKPHSPFFAPQKYHDLYPEDIKMPPVNPKDWDDLPSGATQLMKKTKWFWTGMQAVDKKDPGSYQRFIRSYAACSSFADAQVGRVVDALDSSGRADNTVIVLWSDHGFHLGEKSHIEKFALWEKANHIPFLVVAPGVAKPGSICERPVDMTAIYPTLLELAGLPPDAQCDGKSVVPLLRDPQSAWQPAVMTYGKGNHAVRDDRWRYIRYADGSEELYDHDKDPNEWANLAKNPEYDEIKVTLAAHMPKIEAEPFKDLKRKSY
jgi:arylsulfatase A-like enzyme